MNNQSNYQMVYNPPTAQYFNPQMPQGVQQQQQQYMYQYPTYQYTPGRYVNNTMGAPPHVNSNTPYQGQYTQPINPEITSQQPQTASFGPFYLQDIYGKLESLKRAFEGAHSVQKESLEKAAADKTRITKLEGEVAKLKAELEDVRARQVPDHGSLLPIALRNPLSKEGETEVAARLEFGKTSPLFSGLLKQLEKARSQAAIPTPESPPAVTLGRQLSEEGEIVDDKAVKKKSRPVTRQSTRANKGEIGNARKRIKRERPD